MYTLHLLFIYVGHSDAEVDGSGDVVAGKVGIPVFPKQQSRKTSSVVRQQSPERAKQAGYAEHSEGVMQTARQNGMVQLI